MPRTGLNGAAEMKKRLANIRKNFPGEVARALYQETNIELTEVKKRTPVQYGALRASEHVVGPIRDGMDGERIYTLIVAGGPSAPYAIYVHENLMAIHPVGQAKYIESVIMESRPYMAARVAKRIEWNRVI